VNGADCALPWNVFVLGLASHSLSLNYRKPFGAVKLALADWAVTTAQGGRKILSECRFSLSQNMGCEPLAAIETVA